MGAHWHQSRPFFFRFTSSPLDKLIHQSKTTPLSVFHLKWFKHAPPPPSSTHFYSFCQTHLLQAVSCRNANCILFMTHRSMVLHYCSTYQRVNKNVLKRIQVTLIWISAEGSLLWLLSYGVDCIRGRYDLTECLIKIMDDLLWKLQTPRTLQIKLSSLKTVNSTLQFIHTLVAM